MGSSGGGGSSRPPNQPTPSGPIADFGASTDFNPGFTSVLGPGWATPESIDAGLAAAPQYRTPPPPPSGGMGGLAGMDQASLRKMLTQIMAPPPLSPQQQAQQNRMARIQTMPGYSGGGASMSSGGTQSGGNNRGGYSSSRS